MQDRGYRGKVHCSHSAQRFQFDEMISQPCFSAGSRKLAFVLAKSAGQDLANKHIVKRSVSQLNNHETLRNINQKKLRLKPT
jgi:hypothetical protein